MEPSTEQLAEFRAQNTVEPICTWAGLDDEVVEGSSPETSWKVAVLKSLGAKPTTHWMVVGSIPEPTYSTTVASVNANGIAALPVQVAQFGLLGRACRLLGLGPPGAWLGRAGELRPRIGRARW